MKTLHLICVLVLPGMLATGCKILTATDDLQAVFGPRHISFEKREYSLDLNGDGIPERVVLLADKRRGLFPDSITNFPRDFDVDAFAVFDGRRPGVPALYQYNEYDGYAMRLDIVDGQHVFVDDSGRDHVQHVWGWWRYPDNWPPAGWEAREREWDEKQGHYGPWHKVETICVIVGKGYHDF